VLAVMNDLVGVCGKQLRSIPLLASLAYMRHFVLIASSNNSVEDDLVNTWVLCKFVYEGGKLFLLRYLGSEHIFLQFHCCHQLVNHHELQVGSIHKCCSNLTFSV